MNCHDPIGELEEHVEISTEDLASQFDFPNDVDGTIGDIQIALATALSAIGEQVMDDSAKYEAVANITNAMDMIDESAGAQTFISKEIVEQEFEGDGSTEPIVFDTTQIDVRVTVD